MTSRLLSYLSTPLIITFSVPLAITALVTTYLAFTTLLLRVSIVYVELAFALLQSAITPTSTTTTTLSSNIHRPSHISEPTLPSARHHARRRTSSSSSTASSASLALGPGTQTPLPNNAATAAGIARNASLLSLTAQGTTTPRDYESVGGWRIASSDAEEEALWTGINSRLELPALTIPSPGGHPFGSGARSAGPGPMRRSVASSRRGSIAAGGSPELKPRSPSLRRKRGSGTSSPEGYFGTAGLGMTAAAGEGGLSLRTEGLGARNGVRSAGAGGSKGASRRGSVSLVKVRGE